MRHCFELLRAKWEEGKFVCVGLDSDFAKIPACLKSAMEGRSIENIIAHFNQDVVKATARWAAAYKPNFAFYLAYGVAGLTALQESVRYIRANAPDTCVILDAKWADIDNTNNGYVRYAFEELGVNAVTVNPYLGQEALKPFLEKKDKGFFVLCKTSNKGADEFQNLPVVHSEPRSIDNMRITMPLYQYVAHQVTNHWQGNCGLVVGAPNPDEEIRVIRSIAPGVPLLIPGIGAQGGDLQAMVRAARNDFIINSSRGIIFASSGEDFAVAAGREAEKLHNQINEIRLSV